MEVPDLTSVAGRDARSGLEASLSSSAGQDTIPELRSTSVGNNRDESNDTDGSTVIILSTVLSTFGLILIAGGIWACLRCRRRRSGLFKRGITPIGDDEIETWKGHRCEKSLEEGGSPKSVASPTPRPSSRQHHQKQESTSSTRKPPSVIVYARRSEDQRSPTTPGHHGKISWDGGRLSYDKELPFTPIQARAPNAREGLTDECIPGDDPFIQSPKRRASRLYKQPRAPQQAHTRNRSSRSSLSLNRTGDAVFGYDLEFHGASDEFYPGHSQAYPVSSPPPPRLSLSEDWPRGGGGLSPRPFVRPDEIGRAIG